MMQQLSEILKRMKHWPAERQEDAARLLEAMEQSGTDVYDLSEDERRLVDEGLASSIVPDHEMEKFWRRHRA